MGNIKIRFFVTLPLYPRILWHAVGMSMWQQRERRRQKAKPKPKSETSVAATLATRTHTVRMRNAIYECATNLIVVDDDYRD